MTRIVVHTPRIAGMLLAGWLISSPSAGEEFSWQFAGSYRDSDRPNVLQSNRSALGATYYLSPVLDENGPYELAPFLSRSSRVSVDFGRESLRETVFYTTALDTDDAIGAIAPEGWVTTLLEDLPSEAGFDTSDYSLSGRYVWPESGWYAGAGAQRDDFEEVPQSSFLRSETDSRGFDLFAGKYIGPRMTIEAGLVSHTFRQSLQPSRFSDTSFGAVQIGIFPVDDFSLPIPIVYGSESTAQAAYVSARLVGDMGGLTYSISGSLGSSQVETRVDFEIPTTPFFEFGPDGVFTEVVLELPEDFASQTTRERDYSFSGTLYPTDALGVGLRYSRIDGDELGSRDTVGLSATWFFVRRAAVRLSFVSHGAGGGSAPGSGDSESITVHVLGRF